MAKAQTSSYPGTIRELVAEYLTADPTMKTAAVKRKALEEHGLKIGNSTAQNYRTEFLKKSKGTTAAKTRDNGVPEKTATARSKTSNGNGNGQGMAGRKSRFTEMDMQPRLSSTNTAMKNFLKAVQGVGGVKEAKEILALID